MNGGLAAQSELGVKCMLHPSYQELIDHINEVNREKNIPAINSRYSVVIAAAKRARSLIDGDYPTVPVKGSRRVLSIAVEEMKEEKIGILTKEAAKETATVGYDDMSVVDFSADIEEEE